MPQTSQIKVAFNAGVISPLGALRLDLERAASGCREVVNFIPRAAGPIFKRAGTENLGRIKDDEPAVLKGFNYSINTRFQLEFGAGYVRFWKDRAPVYLAPGAPSVWSGTTTQYDLGTPVFNGNVLYRAASTHTPTGGNQPPSAQWATTNIKKWATAVGYVVGDLISLASGLMYVCITNHTSAASFAVGSNWALITLSPSTTWNTSTSYVVGQKVFRTVSGDLRGFRCISAHTSGASTAPGTGASWTSRWENYNNPPNHDTTSKVYVAGDAVRIGSAVYICKLGHTSSTSNEPLDGGSPWAALTGVSAWTGASTSRAVGDWFFYANGVYQTVIAKTTGTYMNSADYLTNFFILNTIADWTSSPSYLQSAVVSTSANNALYLCIADHTTATTTEPGTEGGKPYWQGLQNLYLWVTGTTYSTGQFVVNSGITYRVASDHTSGTFATDLSNGLLVAASYPLELPTPYTLDDIDELNPIGINDQVWLLHPDKETRLLERFGDTAWRIGDITWDFPPMRDGNIDDAHTLAVSATTGTGATLTSSAKLFDAAMVGGYFEVAHRRDQSTSKVAFNANGNSAALRFNGRLDVFIYGTSWKGDVFLEFSKDGSTNWQVQRSWTQPVANMRTISTFTTVEEETFARLRFVRDGAGTTSDYGIIEAADARVRGLVKITAYASPTQVTVDVVKDVWATTATTLWAEGAYSDYRGWPRAGTVHEQRLYLVGTNDKSGESDKVRGSKVDGFFDFSTSSNADSALAFVAASRESNALMWSETFGKALILGSLAEEWSARNFDSSVLSPSNPPRVERETRMGSAPIPAVLLGDALMFISTDQRKVLEFSYSFADEKHIKQDMTQLSEHLFNAGIKQVAVARNPDPVLYCVMKNGELLSFTYDRNQNVAAWAKHTTGTGLYESVSVVYGGTSGVDEVWFIINRGGKRFVEAYHQETANFTFTGTEDKLCYCDCSVLVEGAPSTIVSGLTDYEGLAVAVLADGKVVNGLTVTSGQITLPTAASVVRIGLPYTASYQGMWLDLQLQDGSAQDRKQRVAQITVFTHNSNGFEYNPDPLDGSTWYGKDTGDRTDVGLRVTRPSRFTVTNPARHGYETNLTIRSNDPLPVNILGLIYLNEFFG